MAYQYLMYDVVIGLTAFVAFHYKNGDFKKVF
jgi:hypothetical protein